MALYRQTAIVLDSLRYGESQLIIKMLTREYGLRSYIVRMNRTTMRGAMFQPLFLVEFEAMVGRGEIHKIQQMAIDRPLSDIPFNVVKSSVALFLAEVLYRIIKPQAVDPVLYDFVSESVVALDLLPQEAAANFHLLFLVRLARYLGFSIGVNHYTPGAWFDIRSSCYTPSEPDHTLKFAPHVAHLLWQVSSCSITQLSELRLSRSERQMFLESVIDFYGYHTDSIYQVQSLTIFRELF